MILYYHKVHPEAKTIWWVTPDTFNEQMAKLSSKQVVYLDEYDPTNPEQVVITFDGVYRNLIQYALPILKKWDYPFELFVIGDYVGKDNSFDSGEPLTEFCSLEELKLLVNAGGRVQWHSKTHTKLINRSEAELLLEIEPSEELVANFKSPNLDWFAFPHGDSDELAIDLARRRFKGALAAEQGSSSDLYNLTRIPATELTNLNAPKTSIVIANYNYGRYLSEAIESVLAQTVMPDEIIVIDDCSTDDSAVVMEKYKDKVTIIRNETNLGIVENFNKAVKLATGDYIGILGADNRMRCDYVEKCIAALNQSKENIVAYTDMVIFGKLAEDLATKVGAKQVGWSETERWPIYYWLFPEATPEVIRNIEKVNFIHGSSMYRKSAWESVGGYKQSQGPEDQHLFSRMLKLGVPVHVASPVIEYRQHSQGQANSVLMTQIQLLDAKSRITMLEGQLAQALADAERLKQSLSWRLTAPVRAVLQDNKIFQKVLAQVLNRAKRK
jgi:peptidoglycan/xylan/chitin deacetylase (PgdA/CDA1 family)